MFDSFDSSNLSISWLFALPVMAVACGAIGYVMVIRGVKQPLAVFLARYGISFLLLFLLESALLFLVPSFYTAMRSLTATLVGGILTLAGVGHSVSGSTIMLQNPYIAFDVTVACLGSVLFWIYIALVMAELKASARQRLTGILIGLAILWGFNFFRITLSVYLESLTSHPVHDYFYLFNIVFVLLVWAGWLRTLRPGAAKLARSTP